MRFGKSSVESVSVYCLALALAPVLVPPLAAQESRWEELNTQVLALYQQGKYAEAAAAAEEALRVAEATFRPEDARTATSLNNLALLYKAQGKYAEAEPLYRRSLTIREKAPGPDHPDVANSLNNLAELYRAQGKYAEAEPLVRRALAILEKALGPDHRYVATALNNLAEIYRAQGKYAEAEPLLRRVLAIDENTLGPNHAELATDVNNLAELYRLQGKYAEAERLFRRALVILEKALGPEHPSVATSLNNLAALYKAQGKYAEAEPLFRRALAIREKALGPDHPDVAQSLNNLAALYKDQGKYPEAEPLYRRSLAIREKALGREHPNVAQSLNNLAALYSAEGIYAQAEPLFDRGLQILAKQFEQQFAYMSEKERLGFLDMLSGNFPLYLSFCLTYREQSPGLAGKMYDTLLWEKGMVASSVAALRAKIAASGDKEALALLEKLTVKKTQLAALYHAQPADLEQWRRTVEQLKEESNDLERELVKRFPALNEEKKRVVLSWRDVQKTLQPAEAAIEIVRFRFHDGKKWTDTSYYVALIVTPETTTSPQFVLLGDAKTLEGEPIRDYKRQAYPETSLPAEEPSFYEAFWKKVEPALAGVRRLYLSPDRELNHVSLGIVAAEDGRPLMEKYDLRIVSSTKDLLRQKPRYSAKTAVLMGNPQFNLTEKQQRAALARLDTAEKSRPAVAAAAANRSRGSPGKCDHPKDMLENTQVEVDTVASNLRQHGWQVKLYTGERALEGVIKRVKGPRLLYVATHGCFESDQERKQREPGNDRAPSPADPMLRSALYFAGANRALSGEPVAADLDDGILTAYEATQLNLQGTELVVLSACETALGEVKNGEGVFGLRRALQEAGAEAVMMTMWTVPDKETRELMTLFYQKWLGGEDKHQALREAQLETRKRVREREGIDLPRLWGAFVLVGR